MSSRVRIELRPLGEVFAVERGTALADVLFEHGVEFPCGGKGRCKGCRIKVLAGALPVTAEQESVLSPWELAEGWRLACRCRADDDLVLEIAQWETAILSDETTFEFKPREGLGVAVDLGTTTLVAQLVDLRTGCVRAVRSALNPQARHGNDIMSRVQYALAEGGLPELAALIRGEIGRLIGGLMTGVKGESARVRQVVLVGNTVMHHLFCGLDVAPLSAYPFASPRLSAQCFRAAELDWPIGGDTPVRFLPCLGGFVGSDILAGILASKMYESEALVGLVDLGTNGEIVLGDRRRMICASTAAGPAFEGARISMGMRAATGAISAVWVEQGRPVCHVLGHVEARGLCGSGLVDAVACGLELGLIQPSGRLAGTDNELPLCPPVRLTQKDVRELQLAKGAIAAGLVILHELWGVEPSTLTRLYLAGAFGNYINRSSARRIGMLDLAEEKIVPAGNTALLGAKIALFADERDGDYAELLGRIEHVSLSTQQRFHEVFMEAMTFPDAIRCGI